MNKPWNEITLTDAVRKDTVFQAYVSGYVPFYLTHSYTMYFLSNAYTYDDFNKYLFDTAKIKESDVLLIIVTNINADDPTAKNRKIIICGKNSSYTFDTNNLPLLEWLTHYSFGDFNHIKFKDELYCIAKKNCIMDDSLFHIVKRNTRECQLECRFFNNYLITIKKPDAWVLFSSKFHPDVTSFFDYFFVPLKPRDNRHIKLNNLYEKYKDIFKLYDSLSDVAKLKLELGGKLTKDDIKKET